MAILTSKQREVIKRSQDSVIWFTRNFMTVKHPAAGVIRYSPWSYQKSSFRAFRKYKNNIYLKTRQAGISTAAGGFALWFGMLHTHKTILIVSRTDLDAKKFLEENVRFPFQHLPLWMQEVWRPTTDNAHEMAFPNGSYIRSLTSAPDVLRSNASSLNIIDESAHIQHMDAMYAAGRPTLQHGGSLLVISTPNGIGNWYWSTWTDSEAGLNDFHPITINWWDMDWDIKYFDVLAREERIICPRAGIRPCTTKAEIDKYGPYWSPWLEEQYKALQARGEAWKFKQEVLHEFLGSGNTVLSPEVIKYVGTGISDQFERVVGSQVYVHPATGEAEELDFSSPEAAEGLWIWRKPVVATPNKVQGGRIIEKGKPAHSYAMGIDFATGKGRDYHAFEIIDVDELEQAAEMMVHCSVRLFKKMVDRVGRWYNAALLVPERNNGGDVTIDELKDELMYPRIWRRVRVNDKPSKIKKSPVLYGQPGFFTSHASKPVLNKCLIDSVRDVEQGGVRIYSIRLWKQFQTYVRKRDQKGRDTEKTEAEDGSGNFDDLVIAFALTLLGLPEAAEPSVVGMTPAPAADADWTAVTSMMAGSQAPDPGILAVGMKHNALPPILVQGEVPVEVSTLAEMERFTAQLARAKPERQNRELLPPVHQKKHVITIRRKTRAS